MKDLLNIVKLLYKGHSLLRVLQIVEFQKIKFKKNDFFADLGSLPGKSHNISSSVKINKIKYFNLKVENNLQKKNTVLINFENIKISDFKFIKSTYDKVLLFNVLEHIYNYKNAVFFSNYILKKNSALIGSTPFMFRLHGSPFDFFRYTEDLLKKELNACGYKQIKIKPLGFGLFTMFFNTIMTFNKYSKILNIFLFIFFFCLDILLNIVSKGNKYNYPIGYYFTAIKK